MSDSATPQVAAHPAPLSVGFSSQEDWSGLPLPSPMCSIVTIINNIFTLEDFPGGPVAKILFPMQAARVGSLVKKL